MAKSLHYRLSDVADELTRRDESYYARLADHENLREERHVAHSGRFDMEYSRYTSFLEAVECLEHAKYENDFWNATGRIRRRDATIPYSMQFKRAFSCRWERRSSTFEVEYERSLRPSVAPAIGMHVLPVQIGDLRLQHIHGLAPDPKGDIRRFHVCTPEQCRNSPMILVTVKGVAWHKATLEQHQPFPGVVPEDLMDFILREYCAPTGASAPVLRLRRVCRHWYNTLTLALDYFSAPKDIQLSDDCMAKKTNVLKKIVHKQWAAGWLAEAAKPLNERSADGMVALSVKKAAKRLVGRRSSPPIMMVAAAAASSLSQSDIPPPIVPLLNAMRCVTCLNLSGMEYALTDDTFAAVIPSLTQLKELNLAGCHAVTPSVLLQSLSSLSKLRSLNLTSCLMLKDIAANGGWPSSLSQLETLVLAHCLTMYGADLDTILAVSGPSLTYLDLCNCATMEYVDLTPCTRLEVLFAARMRAVDPTAAAFKIASCTALRTLDISSSNMTFTTTGLGQLLKLTKLERLHAVGCWQLSDRDVDAVFVKMPSLRYINITLNPQITRAASLRLRAMLYTHHPEAMLVRVQYPRIDIYETRRTAEPRLRNMRYATGTQQASP